MASFWTPPGGGTDLLVDGNGDLYWCDACPCGGGYVSDCQELRASPPYLNPAPTVHVKLLWGWERPRWDLEPGGVDCGVDCPTPPPTEFDVPFSHKSGTIDDPSMHWQDPWEPVDTPQYGCPPGRYRLYGYANIYCESPPLTKNVWGLSAGFNNEWNGWLYFDEPLKWGTTYALMSDTANWGYDKFDLGCWVPDFPISLTKRPVVEFTTPPAQ